jgi:uncharacterized protein YydD (DUF2326 family)
MSEIEKDKVEAHTQSRPSENHGTVIRARSKGNEVIENHEIESETSKKRKYNHESFSKCNWDEVREFLGLHSDIQKGMNYKISFFSLLSRLGDICP